MNSLKLSGSRWGEKELEAMGGILERKARVPYKAGHFIQIGGS